MFDLAFTQLISPGHIFGEIDDADNIAVTIMYETAALFKCGNHLRHYPCAKFKNVTSHLLRLAYFEYTNGNQGL